MRTYDKFYINGQWVEPKGQGRSEVINPATGEVSASVPYGNAEDVDAAVSAARDAFESWSSTSAAERAEYLRKLAAEGKRRNADLTQTIIDELGMPIQNAAVFQVDPLEIICESFAEKAAEMERDKTVGNSVVVKEPIGVCSMINPWNYPIWQMIGKVAPAIAAGCTMVVNAASQTPSHLFMFAEMCDEVGLPPGVFNMVHGSGREIGEALSSHPEVDMVTFTGSTAAGIQVSRSAAPGVKRVCLELGGKSPFIVTEEADLEAAITFGVDDVMVNTGQTCNALTRMIVHESVYDRAVELARARAEALIVGDPTDPAVFGHRRRRAARDRRDRHAAGSDERQLRRTDHFCRCDKRHDHRPGGGFWTGAGHDQVLHGRRGDRDCQRHTLWTGLGRVGWRPGKGGGHRETDPRGTMRHQWWRSQS